MTTKRRTSLLVNEALPLTQTKVRFVVEPLPPAPQRPYLDVIAAIRDHQRVRGHQPATPEEVDTYLPVERESWEE